MRLCTFAVDGGGAVETLMIPSADRGRLFPTPATTQPTWAIGPKPAEDVVRKRSLAQVRYYAAEWVHTGDRKGETTVTPTVSNDGFPEVVVASDPGRGFQIFKQWSPDRTGTSRWLPRDSENYPRLNREGRLIVATFAY